MSVGSAGVQIHNLLRLNRSVISPPLARDNEMTHARITYSVIREWMEGPWGTMDPDKVDGETGNFWRALYKLEKQFVEVPSAQRIASRVCLSNNIVMGELY